MYSLRFGGARFAHSSSTLPTTRPTAPDLPLQPENATSSLLLSSSFHRSLLVQLLWRSWLPKEEPRSSLKSVFPSCSVESGSALSAPNRKLVLWLLENGSGSGSGSRLMGSCGCGSGSGFLVHGLLGGLV